MYFLLDKKINQTLSINFIGTEQFTSDKNRLVLSSSRMDGITKITSYTDTVSGITDSLTLIKLFRFRQDENNEWSDTLNISELTTFEFNKKKPLYIQLIILRSDNTGVDKSAITLSNISIGGEFNYTSSDSQLILTTTDTTQIFELGDVLKIFSITGFKVISSSKNDDFIVKYRFSQNGKRSWTNWEILNTENISTARFDKIRYVEMQYLFQLTGTKPVKIYDVVLYGDFINVTANSMKLNMYGMNENSVNLAFKPSSPTEQTSGINESLNAKTMDSTTLSLLNNVSEYQLRMNWLTQGINCYSNSSKSAVEKLSIENKQNQANLWNPYDFEKLTQFYNFLSNQISDVLGVTIEYNLTDPDGNGIDRMIHEHQLLNVVDYKMIKVLVPDNQFQDNQIVINQYNLDLFDTFKIHILKDEFKNAFGVSKRPSQGDILYFSQTNRLYSIKHAQIHKNVMNSGVYYNVILEKFEKRSNILNRVEESNKRIESLTNNSTIDHLFNLSEKNDFDKIANKVQMKPKSFEMIRSKINSKVVITKQDMYNNNIKIAEYYYILNNVGNDAAITYINADKNLQISDNRSFMIWFNIPNAYDESKVVNKKTYQGYDIDDNRYNFLNNRINDLGYDIFYQSDKIYVHLNDTVYTLDVELMTNIWYALIVNINQRQGKLDINVFRRDNTLEVTLFHPKTQEKMAIDIENIEDIEYEMKTNGFMAINNIEYEGTEKSTNFKLLHSTSIDMTPISFTHDKELTINGSKMFVTNLRLFDDIIDEKSQHIVLNQLYINDAQHIIFADNADKKIKTTNYPNKNWQ